MIMRGWFAGVRGGSGRAAGSASTPPSISSPRTVTRRRHGSGRHGCGAAGTSPGSRRRGATGSWTEPFNDTSHWTGSRLPTPEWPTPTASSRRGSCRPRQRTAPTHGPNASCSGSWGTRASPGGCCTCRFRRGRSTWRSRRRALV